jgi:undecaprenyl-diphosphatase
MLSKSLSLLGGPVARVLLTVAGAIHFLWLGKWRAALLLAGSVAGAGVANTGVKKVVDRHRPAGADAGGESFPSGHTTGTLVFTTVGCYLVWRVSEERVLAVVLVSLGFPITSLVGLSRVVLRDHHPSDIVGSYVLGIAWLGLLLKLTHRFLKVHS